MKCLHRVRACAGQCAWFGGPSGAKLAPPHRTRCYLYVLCHSVSAILRQGSRSQARRHNGAATTHEAHRPTPPRLGDHCRHELGTAAMRDRNTLAGVHQLQNLYSKTPATPHGEVAAGKRHVTLGDLQISQCSVREFVPGDLNAGCTCKLRIVGARQWLQRQKQQPQAAHGHNDPNPQPSRTAWRMSDAAVAATAVCTAAKR